MRWYDGLHWSGPMRGGMLGPSKGGRYLWQKAVSL